MAEKVQPGRDEGRPGRHGRLLLALAVLPPVFLLACWFAIAIARGEFLFPPVWLLLLSLFPVGVMAGAVYVGYRAIVFSFFRKLAARIGDGDEEIPFLVFHDAQELELVAGAVGEWRERVGAEKERIGSAGGLWRLPHCARFPLSGASPVYEKKSEELRKAKGYAQERQAAIVAVGFGAYDRGGLIGGLRKRFEHSGAICRDIIEAVEKNGGLIAEICGATAIFVFSNGTNAAVLSVRALRAAQAIREGADGRDLAIVADLVTLQESMLPLGQGWRYHVEAPEIAQLRALAGNRMAVAGFRLSARLVEAARSRGVSG